MSIETERPRTWGRWGAAVALGSLGAHLCGYAFNLVASRSLGPDPYGELAAVLGIVTIACVPGLAMQAVVSRRTARSRALGRTTGRYPEWLSGIAMGALGLGLLTGLAVALSGFVLGPVLSLSSETIMVTAGVTAAAFPLIASAEGALQGAERFGLLATVFLSTALLRMVGGAVPALLGASPAGVMAGCAVGMVLAAGVALVMVPPLRGRGRAGRPSQLDEWTEGESRVDGRREVRDVAMTLGTLLALVNADLLLARATLPAGVAGLYAAGALVTRAVYWGPQFVAVTVYPSLSDPRRARALLPRAVGIVGALGLGATGVAHALGPEAVSVVLGPAYEALGTELWRFALLGALWACGQLLVSSAVAARDRAIIGLLVVMLVLECTLVVLVWHHTLGQVLNVATATAVVFVGVALVQRLARTALTPGATPPD